MKKWLVQQKPPESFLSSHPELPPTVAQLLWNRQLRSQEQIDEFLNPDYSTDVHDPFLFSGMKKAVEIIFSAIVNNEKIVVHGDYDADGVSASAILIKTLKILGSKNYSVFIPHREDDGYGLNNNTVKSFIEQNINLVITCDCGITNIDQIKDLKEAGIKVIVTDHHAPAKNLPMADAIIHALIPGEKYPDKGLAGAAVAFKLAQGLIKKHNKNSETLPDNQSHEGFEKWLLDLVAIATIGDMVPLIGESRTLARYGLTVLNKTRNLGLKELLLVSSITDETGQPKRGAISAENVSFQIVPRLNAAGRMDHANSAFGLLMAEDEATASNLAKQLNQNNIERQKLTEQLLNQAIKQIKKLKQENSQALFVFDKKWPAGLLGLMAGKLKDLYYKPSFVMTEIDGEIVGSARSIPEFSLVESWKDMEELFSKFGGHKTAGGFSLKSKELLETMKEKTLAAVKKTVGEIELTPQIIIDAEVNLEDVDWKLYDLLQKFEPFGQANEEPLYTASGLTVMQIEPVGQDGKHLKLMVKHNSHLVRKTIAFGFGDNNKHPSDWKKALKPGDKIDLVFTVGVNEWNGNRELELSVKDIKKH